MVAAAEGRLVVKTQRPHRRRVRTSLEREALFLRHLAALAGNPLPVPRVLGHGRATVPAKGAAGGQVDAEIEYTVMTRVPGDAMQRVPIDGAARRAALGELGAVLRRVHGASQEPLLSSGLFPGDRAPGDLRLRLEAPAMEAARKLSATPAAALLPESPEALVRRAVEELPEDTTRVALHSNPSAMHTFVDPDNGAFTGLIDFGDAYLSHPALDLRRWDRHADRVAVLEGYRRAGPVDAVFMRVWRVACLLAELTALAAAPADAGGAKERATVIQSLMKERA